MKLISILCASLIGIVLPIGVGIWLSAKRKGYMKPVLLGAATFCVPDPHAHSAAGGSAEDHLVYDIR